MKYFFTLALLSGFIFHAAAQSRLSIASTLNTRMRVVVDGKKISANNNYLIINNINSGYHDVKVFQLVNSRQGNNRTDGYLYTYQLVYSSGLKLKPGVHTDITLNRFGRSFVDEQPINPAYEEADGWANYSETENGNTGAMDKRTFGQFKNTLSSNAFSDTRMKTAKQVMAANLFTAEQVKEIADLFSFNDDKMTIAKFAYDYTIDKQNYFIVSDAFSFSSSKEELMDFIKNKKQ